jgi:hypothetical protein
MHFPWYPSGQVEISTSARNLLTGFAFPARYFSLLRQRKVPNRKADPKTCPLTRVPCASRHFGRSPNSQDLPRLRLANPAQTGRLAQSRNGCDARLRLRASPCWLSFKALSFCPFFGYSARFYPVIPAQAGIHRLSIKTMNLGGTTPNPVWRSRASQGKPEQARALSERNRAQRDRELRERRFSREAQGIRA